MNLHDFSCSTLRSCDEAKKKNNSCIQVGITKTSSNSRRDARKAKDTQLSVNSQCHHKALGSHKIWVHDKQLGGNRTILGEIFSLPCCAYAPQSHHKAI